MCFVFVFSERAKTFWAGEDVDQVFTDVFDYLDHLKRVLQKNTATDKGLLIHLFFDCNKQEMTSRFLLCWHPVVCPSEYVQGLKLLEVLDFSRPVLAQDSSVVQVVIGSGKRKLLFWTTEPADRKHCFYFYFENLMTIILKSFDDCIKLQNQSITLWRKWSDHVRRKISQVCFEP